MKANRDVIRRNKEQAAENKRLAKIEKEKQALEQALAEAAEDERRAEEERLAAEARKPAPPYNPGPPARECTVPFFPPSEVRPENMAQITNNFTRCFAYEGGEKNHGGIEHWGAYKKWTYSYFQAMGVRNMNDPEKDPHSVVFDSIIMETNLPEPEDPSLPPEMWGKQDFNANEVLRQDTPRHELDELLGHNLGFTNYRYDGVTNRRYIVWGSMGRGGDLHVDPFRTAFVHTHFQGTKRWQFVPMSRKLWLDELHPEWELDKIPARRYFEEIAPVLREFDDVDDCDFTGGQTLVCPRDIYHIVQHVSEHTATYTEQLQWNPADSMVDLMETAMSHGSVELAAVSVGRCNSIMDEFSVTSDLFQDACKNDIAEQMWRTFCTEWCNDNHPDKKDAPYTDGTCQVACDENTGFITHFMNVETIDERTGDGTYGIFAQRD
jgi:hypothetical protein